MRLSFIVLMVEGESQHFILGVIPCPITKELLGPSSDFDKTWCVKSTYGAYHSYRFLAP